MSETPSKTPAPIVRRRRINPIMLDAALGLQPASGDQDGPQARFSASPPANLDSGRLRVRGLRRKQRRTIVGGETSDGVIDCGQKRAFAVTQQREIARPG